MERPPRLLRKHLFCGMSFEHNYDAIHFFEAIFKTYLPSRMIELGTMHGGLSCYLKLLCMNAFAEFYTFDIEDAVKDNPLSKTLKLYENFFLRDVFDNATILEIKALIRQPGCTFIYCDDGDKVREFKTYVKFLKRGDIIGVHDFRNAIRYEDIEREIVASELIEIDENDLGIEEGYNTRQKFWIKARGPTREAILKSKRYQAFKKRHNDVIQREEDALQSSTGRKHTFMKADPSQFGRGVWFLNNLPAINEDTTVLDIGGGFGTWCMYLRLVEQRSFKYTILDNNGRYIDFIPRYFEALDVDAPQFTKHDITAGIPFPPDSFDQVWCFGMYKLSNSTLFKGVYRVLKYNGCFLFDIPSPQAISYALKGPFKVNFTPSQITELLEHCGFEVIKIERIYRHLNNESWDDSTKFYGVHCVKWSDGGVSSLTKTP